MKINVTDTVKAYDGQPLLSEKNQPIQLRTLIINYLNGQSEKEQPSGEEKLKIFELSMKIQKEDEPDLSLDERSLIKTKAETHATPMIYGQIANLLEETTDSEES